MDPATFLLGMVAGLLLSKIIYGIVDIIEENDRQHND